MGGSARKLGMKIALAVLLVNFFVLAMAAVLLYWSRLAHEQRAALATQNLAELLRHNIGDHFDHADAGKEPAGTLEMMFLALKLGEHGSISLRDGDGRLLLRNPPLPASAPPGGRNEAPELRAALAADPMAGTYSSIDGDGVARLHSYRRHQRFGFYVNVGVAHEDFLATWWHEVAVLAGGAAGMLLLSSLSGWHYQRSQRQRQASERSIAALLEENRRLIANLFSANEDQRRKLAHDLHDELGQWLAAIQVNARVLGDAVARSGDGEQIECARTIADSALEINHVIRDMVRLLRPPLLDTMGLQASLEDLLQHWLKYQGKMQADLAIDGDIDHLPEAVNIAVYRILQEALANVTKHARADAVAIRVHNVAETAGSRRQVRLRVEDNGIGIPEPGAAPGRSAAGVGLLGIRERAVALGGSLELVQARPRGCALAVTIPLGTRLAAATPP